MLTLIVARARNGAIGKGNTIPWHAPEDLAAFQRETTGGAVIMGRRTWESLPFKPLKNRLNIVVSRDASVWETVAPSPQAAVEMAAAAGYARLYGIGGSSVYATLLPLAAPGESQAWSDAERALQGRVFIELLAAALAPTVAPAPAHALPGGASDRETDLRQDPAVDEVPERSLQEAPGAVPDRASAEESAPGPAAPSLRPLAAGRLQDWHRALRKAARRFPAMDDEARHRTRRRLKRLRYAVEFSAGLFPKDRVETYLERLREAQERLGEYNDLCVAIAHWEPLAATQPQAWFALGWLSARRAASLERCSDALTRWRKADPFWD